MSHELPECQHVWTGWSTEERKLATGPDGADIVMYVLTRKCLHCGLVDEGKT